MSRTVRSEASAALQPDRVGADQLVEPVGGVRAQTALAFMLVDHPKAKLLPGLRLYRR